MSPYKRSTKPNLGYVMRGVFPFSVDRIFTAGEPGLWLDPSDLTTLFQDSAGTTPVTAAGQPVGRVLDKSGNGNHATQATAGSRPTYQVDASGRGYLSFDGVDDSLRTPTITPGTDKAQMFAGVRKLSDAATGIIAEHGIGGNYGVRISSSGAPTFAAVSRGTVAITAQSASAYAAPVSAVVTGLGDISGDLAAVRTNGVQVTNNGDQGTLGNYAASPIYIGRRGGTTLPFNGRVYGLIARFGAALSGQQITLAERWLNAKTGAF